MNFNINTFAIMAVIATATLMLPFAVESNVFAQKLVPTPATNNTVQNFNQSNYPVIDSLVNDSEVLSQNEVMSQNTSKIQQKASAEPAVNGGLDPNARITVIAEDLLEIRDNIGEARQAFNAGNLFELAEHINNLDNLVTILLTPLPENVTILEKQQLEQQQQQQRK
jgi:hypothetical protein